ncbi:MAG: hypothetical protein Q4P66_08815 [Actinomycetaceae bacterium]|nr:hypothetical protein [Actinomycetaceae bacterium]
MEIREFVTKIENRLVPVRVHGSIEKFHENEGFRSGRHSILYDDFPLDIQFKHRRSKALIVVFHAAKSGDITLPWFSGRGLVGKLNASRLSISDPSLYIDSDLNVGWHAGNCLQPHLQDDLIRIVRRIYEYTGASKLLFLGASAGGFASLLCSYHFKGSTAVVMNPQTSIGEYFQPSVDAYTRIAWKKASLEEIPNHVVHNLLPLYREGTPNKIVYFQNQNDGHHVVKHMTPFLEVVDPNKLTLVKGDWGDGHIAPPKNLLLRHMVDLI